MTGQKSTVYIWGLCKPETATAVVCVHTCEVRKDSVTMFSSLVGI